MPTAKVLSTVSAAALKKNMRILWEDHVILMRNAISCLVDELPGTEHAVKRLLQNQIEIGNTLKPYYGERTGRKLTELLFQYAHIYITAAVVEATNAGKGNTLADASNKWHADADEIAQFLNKENPNWSISDIKIMMNEHLRLITDEKRKRVKKVKGADVVAHEKIYNRILEMPDMLAAGIAKQFPGKFKKVVLKKSS